jgi:hypothetical protein
MSDASGPAADIDEEGYLTGYPLSDSGYYALARTWPAPEMSRPGCVWTHTILIEFSDIPGLASAAGLLDLFRRPRRDGRSYRAELPYAPGPERYASLREDAARRILFTVYSNPTKPVVSSSLGQRERDELVLAIWDQQWPRLKRTFRFCTLSFADRSSAANAFDIQFLPSSGRLPRAQFRAAVDADRQEFAAAEWLDNAVLDLREGASGSLRRFLRAAGSDVSGRESFAPLATLHALSTHFVTEPGTVERAISLLEETIPETQGSAARAIITHAAAMAADSLGPPGLQFVLRNFDLIETDEADEAAERVGRALWKTDPDALVSLLQDSRRRLIAERAIASLSALALLKGASLALEHLSVLLDARPDLGTEPGYWALPGAWHAGALLSITERPEIVPRAIDAMILSERPSVHMALATFGNETVLRRLVALIEARADVAPDKVEAWLSESCSSRGAVARVLGEGNVTRATTLDAMARTVSPDWVLNDFGEDPWLVAIRRVAWSEATPYLATFLLARAFGPCTRNCAELIELAFDTVYTAVERSTLPEDAWRLLEQRLYLSYVWPNWDHCLRVRRTTVAAFVDRDLDPAFFPRITVRDDIFVLLVELAANSFSGRHYLKAVKDRLAGDDYQKERLRIVKRALW